MRPCPQESSPLGPVRRCVGVVEEDRSQCLIRKWTFDPDRLDTAVRTLWNREERRLRRLASLSGVEDSLLTMRDGGLDDQQHAFVMALSSAGYGYEPLAKQLEVREGLLAFGALRRASNRAIVWKALTRLAMGVHLMHRQRILHRNIGAETVYTDPALGPDSWRLGGFDWSIRFGVETPNESTPQRWSFAADELQDGTSFAADWYQFGTLIARLFSNVESIGEIAANQRHDIIVREIDSNAKLQMSRREQTLILRLLGFRTEERLISGEQVVDELDAITQGLASGAVEVNRNVPLVIAFSPLTSNVRLLDACKNAGFYPEDDKLVPYRSEKLHHVAALRDFIQTDLRDTMLHRLAGGQKAILTGERLTFLITQFTKNKGDEGSAKPSWDLAFLIGPTELRGSDPESQRDLRGLKILPVAIENLSTLGPSQPWTAVLPPIARGQDPAMTRDLAQMHDFVRCTNQVDLLFTSARIFPYLIEKGPWIDENGWEHLDLVETVREYELPGWSLVKDGLYGMLQEEISSAKDHCREVLLTDHARLSVGHRPEPQEWWEIRLGRAGEPIHLKRRQALGGSLHVPARGFIRTYGLYGQFSLVERRKRAIDRLKDHKFLLRTLADPVCWDSKVYNEDMDFPQYVLNKRPVMIDIERVRPLYALQGPPGTGKTTLEAHHLRRVFDAHPEAQVLVTAQAHAAVDVLRSRVNDEAYADVAVRERPLAIRLGRRDDDQGDADSVETVSQDLLKECHEALRTVAMRTPLQERWLKLIERGLLQGTGKTEDTLLRSIRELLKSGAAITYCTTSAADLAALAESSEFDHTYDLVIVEESGRVHAFDLALPLQAGHRWLLLGDHKQLPGFQIRNFEEALKDLNSAIAALERLGDMTYTDADWISRWKALPPVGKDVFKVYALIDVRRNCIGTKISCSAGKSPLTFRSLMNCCSYSRFSESQIVLKNCANLPIYSGLYWALAASTTTFVFVRKQLINNGLARLAQW